MDNKFYFLDQFGLSLKCIIFGCGVLALKKKKVITLKKSFIPQLKNFSIRNLKINFFLKFQFSASFIPQK